MVIKSCVRVPANTSACPPGFSTRCTSFHREGGGTNPSHSFDINPLPSGTNESSPLIHSEITLEISGSFDKPYGGSHTTESILLPLNSLGLPLILREIEIQYVYYPYLI